jgi:hypothetical protein
MRSIRRPRWPSITTQQRRSAPTPICTDSPALGAPQSCARSSFASRSALRWRSARHSPPSCFGLRPAFSPAAWPDWSRLSEHSLLRAGRHAGGQLNITISAVIPEIETPPLCCSWRIQSAHVPTQTLMQWWPSALTEPYSSQPNWHCRGCMTGIHNLPKWPRPVVYHDLLGTRRACYLVGSQQRSVTFKA